MCNYEITPVPDFTKLGFETAGTSLSAEAQKHLEGVQALKLSACVGASYDSNTNSICFQIPIYGNFCIPSPVHIPVGADLKACAETCGSFIPTGLKVTLSLNGNPIVTKVVWGSC